VFSALAARIAFRFLLIAFSCSCLIGTASAQRITLDSDANMGTGGRYVIQGTVIFFSGQLMDRRRKDGAKMMAGRVDT
jgi:hypothetical protein